MGFPRKLAQAKQLAIYWDNYINYLSTVDDRQPNIGQGTPKPPQTALYLKPFGVTLDTDQYLKANGTSSRWTTYTAAFANYTKATIDTGGGESSLALKRIKPARVVITTGMSTTKSIKSAKTTKRKYITYGGVAGSVPFGKNATDSEVEAFNIIKAAIENGGNFQASTMKISRVKEYV